MASIHKEIRNGKSYYRLQFYDKDRKRRSVRLGQISRKGADTICTNVEHLVSASISGSSLDGRTSLWVTDIGSDLAEKLARVGLIGHRESSLLLDFIDSYIDSRTDIKSNTIRNWKNTRQKLAGHFGPETRWSQIKPGDADDWRQGLVNAKLSEATISKEVKNAKMFGRLALRKELCKVNPFADLAAGSQCNASRIEFVGVPKIQRVIDAAPNAEWRLIIALARFGGLRTPSETLALKWSDIDWDTEKITVPSPKTERSGKSYRVIPLFPELRPYLDEMRSLPSTGSAYVIPRYRGRDANLRTQFLRIIRRAGEEAWPRLFHNLRASRQTELENHLPSHVVADWLGNSVTIARLHYLKTNDDHFSKALQILGGARGGAAVVQEVVPQSAAMSRTQKQKTSQALAACDVMPNVATSSELVQLEMAPPRRLELLLPE